MAGTLSETIDIDCVSDIKPHLPTASGRLALAQALARRLQTPRGKAPWWPNYGTDVQQFVLAKVRPSIISAAVRAECLKDERVESVDLTVSVDGNATRLDIQVTDAEGPFTFTLSITEAAASLIAFQRVA